MCVLSFTQLSIEFLFFCLNCVVNNIIQQNILQNTHEHYSLASGKQFVGMKNFTTPFQGTL